jgi:hypothetical protein
LNQEVDDSSVLCGYYPCRNHEREQNIVDIFSKFPSALFLINARQQKRGGAKAAPPRLLPLSFYPNDYGIL